MKTAKLLFGILLFCASLQAQEQVTDLGFDKAKYSLGKVMDSYNPKHSHFGNIYFIVCQISNSKLKNGKILFLKNGGFDTTEIRDNDLKSLEPVLLNYSNKEDMTIIAPYIYIKDPKRLPTNEFLYRESVPRDLTKALYLITRKNKRSIIFPVAEGLMVDMSISQEGERRIEPQKK